MKNKILIILILCLLMLPLILAETHTRVIDDVYKVGVIRYAKPCFFNETYCSSTAECNLTVFYPNNSLVIDNQVMTNRISEHNISFESRVIGIHKSDMVCKDQGFLGANSFYFEVNQSGTIFTNSQSIVYIITFFGSLFLFIILIFSAVNSYSESKRDPEGFLMGIDYWKYVRWGLWLFAYLTLLWTVNILVVITNNFLPLGIATVFFRMIYFFLLIGLLPVVPIVFYIFIYNIIRDKELRNAIERGIRVM